MKIALAEIAQETGSFSPMTTGLAEFETYGLYRGEQIIEHGRGLGPLGGFLEIASEQPEELELVPIIRAWASAGGIIREETLTGLLDELLAGLKDALPVDAVFLSLHGAAAAEQDDDVEGFVLSAVRQIVGPDVPIAVTLDHHANITQRMADHASLLVAHETQPHDPPATGRKTARLLFALLQGEVTPAKAWRKIPMVTPQDQFLTSGGPMKEWFDEARRLESEAGVLDVSPCPMQPWLDVAEAGWAVVVHTNDDQPEAERLASQMANLAWQNRARFWESERIAADEAVRQTLDAKRGLIILSDTGDSVYGGAPGDSTIILRAILNATWGQTDETFLVPLIDPESLEAAFIAGLGNEISIAVGGKVDNVFSQPVDITAKVASVSAGHRADLGGRGQCELGRTALLECGPVKLILLEQRSFAINHPVLYEHHGIEIAEARAVVVKTASNFQFFAPWRAGLIRVDSAGMTQSDLTAFDWQHAPRPIYPLDDVGEWDADSGWIESS